MLETTDICCRYIRRKTLLDYEFDYESHDEQNYDWKQRTVQCIIVLISFINYDLPYFAYPSKLIRPFQNDDAWYVSRRLVPSSAD